MWITPELVDGVTRNTPLFSASPQSSKSRNSSDEGMPPATWNPSVCDSGEASSRVGAQRTEVGVATSVTSTPRTGVSLDDDWM